MYGINSIYQLAAIIVLALILFYGLKGGKGGSGSSGSSTPSSGGTSSGGTGEA